jgi:hypothetical protein
MRAKLPSVRADVKVLDGQAYCKLINMTGHFVRFRLPRATVKVPGNTVGNVVAEFIEGFSISTEETGLLFGDDVKTTRGGQPWNVRNTMGEQAPPPVERPLANPEPVVEVEVEAPVVEATVQATVEAEPVAEIDTADLTVLEVLDWVGADPKRKAAALKSELAGKARKGLLATLSA